MSKTLLTFAAVAVLLSGAPVVSHAMDDAMTNDKMMAKPEADGAMMEKKPMDHKKMTHKSMKKDMDKGMMKDDGMMKKDDGMSK